MGRQSDREDGIQSFEGGELRAAMKRLAKGSMNFALGYADRRTPILVLHRSKSPKALGRVLREEAGAVKATWGVADADGSALVLDVEGPPMSGMRKMVKQVLKREHVTAFKETRLLVNGEEEEEDEAEGGGEVDAELAALRERIESSSAQVSAMLQRLGHGDGEERAYLISYCRDCGELERRARECADSELIAFGRSCGGRARKIAALLKQACAPAPAPVAGIGASVGKGGQNRPADVARVQALLGQHGYAVAADGLCGPATIAAICAFQKARLGMADGLVEPGRNTWRALNGGALARPKGYGAATKPTYERRPIEYELPAEYRGGHATESGETRKYSGTVYSHSSAEGELQILSGSIEESEYGISASGYVAQTKTKGETNTIGQAEYKRGYFEDGEQWWLGERGAVAGAKKEIDFGEKYGLPDEYVIKGDAGAGTASAEAWISDEGMALGAQANVAEGSLTLGSQGTGDRDGTVRFGLSEGVGLAGRVHWGDKDKDDNPEYGVGADFGPVSFDVKTEDPLRWVTQNGPSGPIGMLSSELHESNMTNDALGAAADAGRTVRDVADRVSDFLGGGD